MTLREALETGEVDRALDAARNLKIDDALAQARDVAAGQGTAATRAAAVTVMARLAVQACPLPGSPATDTADIMAAKSKARETFLADQRARLQRLAADSAPAVAAAASAALIDTTEDHDLDALRPELAGARDALAHLAETDGDAAMALLRLEGGRAAVPWLVELAAGRLVSVPVEALTSAVARSPVPEALAPLVTLLEKDPLLARRLRAAPASGDASGDRVRGIAQAIAAIDRGQAMRLAEKAPADVRPFLDDGIVDDAIQRLVAARPTELPTLQTELGALLPQLQARCDAGDARAIPAALRLGGEALTVRWIDQIANGGSAPAPLDMLAEEASRLGYRSAAPPLAHLVEDANRNAQSSAAWAALVGHDAAAAVRALRVLDPARATALVAAAPAPLRQRLQDEQ